MDSVTDLGGAAFPEEIKDVLNKGPKYSFQPSTYRPELLAMVRRVANSAGEQHRERAIGDGVDCLKESAGVVMVTKEPLLLLTGEHELQPNADAAFG
ncbi:hypothetical protein HPB47_016352 [Ixodes persulcatus]|uniref:Uncharacterized protein n=1 Tax=Ixodes persulcatus TaxID=34615 RepID=A0AC60QR38_IXOPE|nr:hypothetical protein HPB47_016352 [Ixodes persulcatus]